MIYVLNAAVPTIATLSLPYPSNRTHPRFHIFPKYPIVRYKHISWSCIRQKEIYIYTYIYIYRDNPPWLLPLIICSYHSWNVKAEDHCTLYKWYKRVLEKQKYQEIVHNTCVSIIRSRHFLFIIYLRVYIIYIRHTLYFEHFNCIIEDKERTLSHFHWDRAFKCQCKNPFHHEHIFIHNSVSFDY